MKNETEQNGAGWYYAAARPADDAVPTTRIDRITRPAPRVFRAGPHAYESRAEAEAALGAELLRAGAPPRSHVTIGRYTDRQYAAHGLELQAAALARGEGRGDLLQAFTEPTADTVLRLAAYALPIKRMIAGATLDELAGDVRALPDTRGSRAWLAGYDARSTPDDAADLEAVLRVAAAQILGDDGVLSEHVVLEAVVARVRALVATAHPVRRGQVARWLRTAGRINAKY